MRHAFTEADAESVRTMRAQGMSWHSLSRVWGCSEETVRRLIDLEYRERRADRYRPVHMRQPRNYGNPSRMTSAEAARVLDTVPQDTRSLSAKLMGDPLPGRSALDRKPQSINPGVPRDE